MLSGMSNTEKHQAKRAAVIHTGAVQPYARARLALCFGQLSSNDSPLGLAQTKAALRFASGYAAASADAPDWNPLICIENAPRSPAFTCAGV